MWNTHLALDCSSLGYLIKVVFLQEHIDRYTTTYRQIKSMLRTFKYDPNPPVPIFPFFQYEKLLKSPRKTGIKINNFQSLPINQIGI